MEHSRSPSAAVADWLRARASWRRDKAREYPTDLKNARSADALEAVAAYSERLPPDHAAIAALVDLDAFDPTGKFISNEDTRRSIARLGYSDATDELEPKAVLEELVALTRRARGTSAREREQRMATRTIPEIPELPAVLWVVGNALASRILWHAAQQALPGDRVLTFCDKVIELGGASREQLLDVERAPVPGCGPCEGALQNLLERSDVGERDPRRELLEDLFQICREYDRPSQAIDAEIRCRIDTAFGRPCSHGHEAHPWTELTQRRQLMELSDRLTEHHIATTDLSAVVAPAAIEMADSISPWSSSASGATLSKTDRHRIAAKLFAKAGRSAHLMSNAELHPPGRELADDGAERPDDLISLSLRTSIAADLRSAKKALRLASSIPTEENVTALEQHLLNARDTAEPVHAYRVRLDDAISCARGLREAKTGGDRLELTGRAHSAIDTVLENLMV